MSIKYITCVTLLLFPSQYANAEITPPLFYPAMDQNLAGMVMHSSYDPTYLDENERVSSQPQPSASPSAPVNFRFTPSTSQRSKNMKNFIAEVAKVSPEYAPQLAAELGNGAAFGAYAQRLESIGLDPNNVSDNFAAWWLTAWEASAGRPIDVPESAFSVVKAQVDRMLNNPQIAALSNADKQKMSDDMIVRTLIMANQIDQAKANPEFARQLAEGTKKSTKASGLDLDAMTLTPEGFRPKGKKRGDASGAGADIPGAVPASQLAANAEATPAAGATGEGWSAGTVALIAAAGGIGAAGVFAIGKASGSKKG